MLPFIGCGTGMVNSQKVVNVYFEILSKETDITFIICDKNEKMINSMNTLLHSANNKKTS